MEKPENINPALAQNFRKFIEEKSKNGSYQVEVQVGGSTIPIEVFPTVFPPKSDYSASSKSIFDAFGDLQGLEVADIGSGTGIQSIIAIMAGAKHVDASDINQHAIDCTQYNVERNDLQKSIHVFHSDLLRSFPKKQYDLIIANLPIVNFKTGDDAISNALYDEDLKLHKRLLEEAKQFLSNRGAITFTHANLQSAKTENPMHDFKVLEMIIHDFGYRIIDKAERNEFEQIWINYKIVLE